MNVTQKAQDNKVIKGSSQPQITFHSDVLKMQQRIHAIIFMIIIPTLGAIAAVIMAVETGIKTIDIVMLSVMYFLTSLGITLGYHRYFAHRSFQTTTACQVILGILGSMSCQGPLIYWASSHRRHHRYSDVPGDPHSPYIDREKNLGWWQGFYHSHMGWTYGHELTNSFLFAKDLVLDKTITMVNKYYYYWVILGLLIPAALEGIVTQSWMGVFRGFIWGGLLRLFLVHHSSWTIGSIAHIYAILLSLPMTIVKIIFGLHFPL